MTDKNKDYALMFYDDPFEECLDCFWSYLGEDNTLSKEFLEYLQQLADDIETGKEKVVPMDELLIKQMKDLVGDLEVD